MSSELSQMILANGFDLKQNIKDQRNANSNEQLAQVLKQSQINQRDAQADYYNKQARGQSLQNTKLATDMSRGPQNTFQQVKGNDNNLYNVEYNSQGNVVNSTLMQGMGNAPAKTLKIPPSLFSYLTPEQQGNPSLVTPANLVVAARARNEKDNRPDPLEQMNKRQEQQQIDINDAKIKELEVKSEKGRQLGEKAKSLASELLNHPGLDSSVGTVQGSFMGQAMTVDGDSQNFINRHNQLKSILTAENLDMMTGVLSETDIRILSDIAGGGLQLKGSEDAYRNELVSMGGLKDTDLPDGMTDNGDGTFTLPDGRIVRKE